MGDGKLLEITSGEYYVTRSRNYTITTLLGSCVAVCLYDLVNGIGGMNHYMLPGPNVHTKITYPDPRYGTVAMELLLKEVLKKGADYEALQAKVFGGGEMFVARQYNIAKENIRFALTYLASKEIPIVAMDVGGVWGRKVFYSLKEYNVFVRKNVPTALYGSDKGE